MHEVSGKPGACDFMYSVRNQIILKDTSLPINRLRGKSKIVEWKLLI